MSAAAIQQLHDALVHSPDFWQGALDSLTSHIAVLDGEGRILAVNAAWKRFACSNGAPDASRWLGVNYLAVCEGVIGANGEEGPSAAEGIRQVFTGRRREFALPYPCHSPKKKRWFMMRVSRFDGPGPARVIVSHENITAPKMAALRAQRAEALAKNCQSILERIASNEPLNTLLPTIASLLEHQAQPIEAAIFLLREGKLEFAAATRFPIEWQRIADSVPPELLLDETSDLTASLAKLRDRLVDTLDLELPSACNLRWVPLRTGTGPVRGFMAFRGLPQPRLAAQAGIAAPNGLAPLSPAAEQAISLANLALDHRRLYEQLAFQAQHDALTGLPNRLLFHDRLQQVLLRSRRGGQLFAVLMVDIDHFKQVNDLHGHRVGDGLLRQVAHRICSAVRESDTVARLSGDEFIIILDELRDTQAPKAIAQKLTAAFQEPFCIGEQRLFVTCSVGMSVHPDNGLEAGTLVRNADAALYEAKNGGRNTFRCYTEQLGTEAAERTTLEKHLREALQKGEFSLEYQPQLDLQRNITGMEALLRWNNPEIGRVSPTRFVPIAEESGWIVPIGEWALREACRQGMAWQAAGYAPMRMAVNISTVQLARPNFAGTVAAILEETRFLPSLLELEVTETAMMQNKGTSMREMERLRELGVRLSIDDFGTGYCSLSYLQNLPVDTVKIDRSFLAELHGGSLAILRAIVGLAHDLELKVAAEGVETEAQFETLGELQCDIAQGYLLHRPLVPQRIEALLAVANRQGMAA